MACSADHGDGEPPLLVGREYAPPSSAPFPAPPPPPRPPSHIQRKRRRILRLRKPSSSPHALSSAEARHLKGPLLKVARNARDLRELAVQATRHAEVQAGRACQQLPPGRLQPVAIDVALLGDGHLEQATRLHQRVHCREVVHLQPHDRGTRSGGAPSRRLFRVQQCAAGSADC